MNDSYTGFAEVYDELMDNVPYEEWAAFVVSVLKEYGVGGVVPEDTGELAKNLATERNTVLDLGCGTGTLTELLARAGFDMIGVDNSEEMLEIAIQKRERSGSDILYLLQDMREFELYGTVGAVCSVCDSLNYILEDEDMVKDYLSRMLDKEVFDKRGLIYGMGHAVYSISDPRATIFKSFVEKLAMNKGREEDFKLYSMIERLAPQVIGEKRNIYKGVSANVDFYSGFVYSMLDIPLELYTPIFAMARIVGWSAHRLEELINVDKIIRPAYKSIAPEREYVDLEKRG